MHAFSVNLVSLCFQCLRSSATWFTVDTQATAKAVRRNWLQAETGCWPQESTSRCVEEQNLDSKIFNIVGQNGCVNLQRLYHEALNITHKPRASNPIIGTPGRVFFALCLGAVPNKRLPTHLGTLPLNDQDLLCAPTVSIVSLAASKETHEANGRVGLVHLGLGLQASPI